MVAAIAERQLPACATPDFEQEEMKRIVFRPEFRLKRRPCVPGVLATTTPRKDDSLGVERKVEGWTIKVDPELLKPANKELYDDANRLLDQIIADGSLKANAVYGFWPAASDDDDAEDPEQLLHRGDSFRCPGVVAMDTASKRVVNRS